MGRAEDTLMCMGIFYLILLFIAVSTALFATSAAQNYPLYEVKPIFCDNGMYALHNETWMISDPWHLLPTRGACPVSKRTVSLAAGSNAYTANYNYKDCISFSRKGEWSVLDTDNADVSFSSNFHQGSIFWANSGHLSQTATLFLWLTFLSWIIVYCYRKKPIAYKLIYVPYIFMLLSSVLWIGALDAVNDTSQLDIDAWSKVFFKSCTVIIPRGPAYVLGTYVCVTTGFFLFLFLTMYAYYHNRDFIIYNMFDPDSEAKQARYYIIGEAFKERERSLLDFHSALVDHIYFSLSIFWKDARTQAEEELAADMEEGEVREGNPIKLLILGADSGTVRFTVSVLDTAKVSELNELVRVQLNKGRGKPDTNKSVPLPLYKARQLHLEFNRRHLENTARLTSYGITGGENITLSLDAFGAGHEEDRQEGGFLGFFGFNRGTGDDALGASRSSEEATGGASYDHFDVNIEDVVEDDNDKESSIAAGGGGVAGEGGGGGDKSAATRGPSST